LGEYSICTVMAGDQSRETLRGLLKIQVFCTNTFLLVYTCIYFKGTLTLRGNFLHLTDAKISEVSNILHTPKRRSTFICNFTLPNLCSDMLKVVLGEGATEREVLWNSNSSYLSYRLGYRFHHL
jgi:hypothetical protein